MRICFRGGERKKMYGVVKRSSTRSRLKNREGKFSLRVYSLWKIQANVFYYNLTFTV